MFFVFIRLLIFLAQSDSCRFWIHLRHPGLLILNLSDMAQINCVVRETFREEYPESKI